jgi:uncharacterized membrane protein
MNGKRHVQKSSEVALDKVHMFFVSVTRVCFLKQYLPQETKSEFSHKFRAEAGQSIRLRQRHDMLSAAAAVSVRVVAWHYYKHDHGAM